MKRDKAKVVFGVSGIAISLFLLTAIGMLNDTLNYNYMKLITNTTGSSDIMITKTVQTDLSYDPFFDEKIIEDDLDDIEGVEELFPRIMILSKVSSDKTNKNGTLAVYGIDFEAEYENGNMGDFVIVDEDGDETDEIYDSEPDNGECVILQNAAEILNVKEDDIIHLEYEQYALDVIVDEVCEQHNKFMDFENALIILNLEQAQNFINRPDQINFIMGTIENPESVYDVSNVDTTTLKLRRIATRIQERLDLNDFEVTMPKLEELEASQYNLMSMTILFWFITLLSMLITGILINSILSTSIEERVREFGIIRVVGGKKNFTIKMVLFEGLMLGVLGSVIGTVFGIIFTPYIAQAMFAYFELDWSDIEFIIQPSTLIFGLVIGSLVSLLISLIPALKAAKLDLIKSITPFQSKEEGWEIKKEESMNVKSFIFGICVATIGMIVFVLLPRIFTTGNIMLISALFIGLLSAILIGLVFASVGIIPLMQQLFIGILSPAMKKYANIVKISLKRYRRRNTSTVVMFAISFSFIFFVTSVNEIESETLTTTLKFQYGSDLVLVNQGLDADDAITLEMIAELEEIGGIDSMSYALHNTFDFQAIVSLTYEASEGGFGFEESSSAEEKIRDLFQYYSTIHEQKFKVTVGDISSHDEIEAGFIGVNDDFTEMIDEDLLIWSSPDSDYDDSFDKMFENNDTCILAKSIASIIGVEEVGEKVRLTFYDPEIEDDPGNVMLFTVAGISGGIPGFWNFRSNERSAYGGGLMVSLDNYIRLMEVKDAHEPDMIVDKVFINLRDNSEDNIEETKDDIMNLFRDRNFIIDDVITKVNFIEEMNNRQNTLMEIILMFTIMISIFGLISSMYAIMLERKFEIGVLRSMGMKARNVRNMFLIESLVLLLSAGIMGTLIGSFSAYLLETNIGLFTETPVNYVIPIATLLRVFISSVVIGVIGMYIILWKMSRQNIMEIFRQTF
jgi:ABC-type antimicrobial peptide transport system permease subunit